MFTDNDSKIKLTDSMLGILKIDTKNNVIYIKNSVIKENDIITAVNGTEIGSSGSLSSLIGEYSVGDTVKITVVRGGKTETLELTLAAYKQ